MKRLLIGCAALLALGVTCAQPTFADPASDNAAAARKDEANAKAERDRAAHYAHSAAGHAKAAIDASAALRKDSISRHADYRKHRLAANSHHSEHAISESADEREQAITNSAQAEKHALDQQQH